MGKLINIRRFMEALFDDRSTACQAVKIGQAMLAARSLHLSE